MDDTQSIELRFTAHDGCNTLLAAMLNSNWGPNIIATPEIMRGRFATGNLFVFAFDHANEEDQRFISKTYGLHVAREEIIPVGLLETIAIRTSGDYSAVPRSYDLLTDSGRWRAPAHDADTLIMVDVTTLTTRRGKNGKGEAKKIVNFTKKLVEGNENYGHVWTFTPLIPEVKKWHMGLGARDTEHVIANARPGYRFSDVNLMVYKG